MQTSPETDVVEAPVETSAKASADNTAAAGATADIALAVRDHLVSRLRETVAQDQPFSHLYLENFFPDSVYQRILACPPPAEYCKGLNHKEAMRSDGSSTRQVFPFNPGNLERLQGEAQTLWRGITEGMQAPEVKQALFECLGTDLASRFKVTTSAVPDIEAHPKTGYFCDHSGYQISPHRDVARKIVTMQVYLPADRSQESMGTSLYERGIIGRLQYEFRKLGLGKKSGFREVKRFPFVPNSAYAFVVGKHSWHGRPEIHGESERRSLMQIYYANPSEPFYD
ncbi:hypothetical protein [Microbulbifer sp. YPW1]|uniref:hypothetical protein n=1 Tax=Microbulbifer sp. YPW1 TaxID=2745199 RepID=UPI00159A4329|nr:hypothetical protein [Microbulbifer sp. YPW1]QKX16174.1 hypothetical protein HUW35_03785 [Microbulbifer sp. YPW1]